MRETCTCTLIRLGSHIEPAEWEQADDCPVHPLPMTRDPRASAGDGLRLTEAEREALGEWPSRFRLIELVERILRDRAALAAHPEPGEAASVGDGLAGVLAEHRRNKGACTCGHDYGAGRGAYERHAAHLAAVIVRDWLPSEVARLRAKVERVEALADEWTSAIGQEYAADLRAALEDGDR